MKIVYCIHFTHVAGGMQRVLTQKANYLAEVLRYEVVIVTTDQKKQAPFFSLSPRIAQYDLEINYSDNTGSFLKKYFTLLSKKRKHKAALEKLLFELKADIVISMFDKEASFLCDIRDGSRKVLEFHYSKYFRKYTSQGIAWKILSYFLNRQDEQSAKRFDRFIVLTYEDKENWGRLPNIEVIPNPCAFKTDSMADTSSKRIIAVGRYCVQKGFDRLIDCWNVVHQVYSDWKLEIFGDGELRSFLQNRIDALGVKDSVLLKSVTTHIEDEYLNSSIFVLPSRFEGLPLVLMEAMECGVPPVAFTCKCGPKDIIENGVNGYLVENGDIRGFADSLMQLMADQDLRKKIGIDAKQTMTRYTVENIMKEWDRLFHELVEITSRTENK
ncbi:MAG: glycosyltransferase family 4 protein [Butyricimonas virosa]|jgi:hypothetical protein|uniref:glycosyltransferase family 4 protein n=1 Tax=Butyricimonas virosa TaxID=544645 RepID=UPI0024319B7E|nr:glycosyltransferase family 4 protein [Butyricimonas virosa]MDY5534612.1 glycosyltransferase family 4 protein [Butyricimonas virosa]